MCNFIYTDWKYPIKHYWTVLKGPEKCYEIIAPIIISIICIIICWLYDGILPSILKLRDLLPSALSILIGFTITSITMLVSNESASIKVIKEKKTNDRTINGEVISLYQWLLILFIYVLIAQSGLLLLSFLSVIIARIVGNSCILLVVLGVETFFLLHIVFLLIRCISYIYFTYFITE